MLTPPILSSIGTVLIDVFDRPPLLKPITAPPTPEEQPQRIDVPIRMDTPDMAPYEVIGGGGLYAIIGARLWLDSRDLRTMIDRAQDGSDFPLELEKKLSKLGKEMWVYNEGPQTRTPRARIGYSGDVRTFEHLIPPPKRTISSLAHTSLYYSEYLHVVSAPSDIADLYAEFTDWRPKIVFEPHPMHCGPDQGEWLEKVLSYVEILSPNHEELMSLFSEPIEPLYKPGTIDHIESMMSRLLDMGVGLNGDGVIIVRCGRSGACVGTRKGGLRWVPAYFQGPEQWRVRDVTGAGNAFLGGYVAGLALVKDPYQAALYATVSASFVVEQSGLPVLDVFQGKEIWNDETPIKRVERLRRILIEEDSFWKIA